jgi:outer membrane biosynthesis protein TonB
MAAHAGIEGTVELSVAIDQDGYVQEVNFVAEHLSKLALGFGKKAGEPLLGPAAIKAVRRWKYQPTLLNGNPVEVATTVNVTFKLSDR